MKNLWFSTLLILGAATSAAAQEAPAPAPPATASPLIVERIENSWLIAPDARVGDIDGLTGAFAGAYAGYLIDKTLLIGGAGYWLANGDGYHEMAYGGLVVEWMAMSDRPIGFSLQSLVGGGLATMPVTYYAMGGGPGVGRPQPVRPGGRPGTVPVNSPRVFTAVVEDDFFIFEPQANLVLNLAKQYRVSVGVSYRVVGAAHEMNHQLDGLSGAVSLRILGN